MKRTLRDGRTGTPSVALLVIVISATRSCAFNFSPFAPLEHALKQTLSEQTTTRRSFIPLEKTARNTILPQLKQRKPFVPFWTRLGPFNNKNPNNADDDLYWMQEVDDDGSIVVTQKDAGVNDNDNISTPENLYQDPELTQYEKIKLKEMSAETDVANAKRAEVADKIKGIFDTYVKVSFLVKSRGEGGDMNVLNKNICSCVVLFNYRTLFFCRLILNAMSRNQQFKEPLPLRFYHLSCCR
jgi:hypothetical protein